MANIYEPQKKALDAIYPNLNEVVDFLSKKLKVGEAMPSGTIFSKVWKGKAPFIESQFKLGFSAAVNTGILLGMKGAKRSGFRKIGNVSLSDIKPDSVEVFSAKSNRSSSPPVKTDHAVKVDPLPSHLQKKMTIRGPKFLRIRLV